VCLFLLMYTIVWLFSFFWYVAWLFVLTWVEFAQFGLPFGVISFYCYNRRELYLKKTWMEVVKIDLKKCNLSKNLAQDR
jgi:hypothetical protein